MEAGGWATVTGLLEEQEARLLEQTTLVVEGKAGGERLEGPARSGDVGRKRAWRKTGATASW